MDALKAKIRHIPDFPKPGILFYDVTTLLRDAEGFRLAIDALSAPYRNTGIDLVVGVESRGFILGAAVADRLGCGFVPVRKVGKLPGTKIRATYDLEYGTDSLEMHDDAIAAGQRVLVVDDLLATGGTARATVDLVKQVGGGVAGVAFLIELVALGGRARLEGESVLAILEVLKRTGGPSVAHLGVSGCGTLNPFVPVHHRYRDACSATPGTRCTEAREPLGTIPGMTALRPPLSSPSLVLLRCSTWGRATSGLRGTAVHSPSSHLADRYTVGGIAPRLLVAVQGFNGGQFRPDGWQSLLAGTPREAGKTA